MTAAAISIRRNASWMLAGTGVYAASQWIIAIVLARLGGPEAVGLFAFASALSMPVVIASQLALRQVLITDVRQRYAFADFFRLRLLATLIAFFLIVVLAFALGYRNEALVALIGIAAGRCFESVSDIHYGRMQRNERLDNVAQYTMLRGALCVLSVTIVYASTLSMAAAGVTFGVACALSAFVVDSRNRDSDIDTTSKRRGRWMSRYGTSLAVVALPLAASQLFNNLNVNVPRFVLEDIGGTAMVGQYAVIEHFIAAAYLIVQAAGQAAAPQLARRFAATDLGEFNRLLGLLFLFFVGTGVLATVAVYLAGPMLIRLVYGPGFEAAEQAFVWFMAAATLGFASSVLGYAVTATGRFAGLAWRYALIAATTLLSSLLLTPLYGWMGLAGAIAIGNVVGCLIPLQFLWRAIQASPRGNA